ncbi:hypothetical protein HPT29_019840 [Microvirga terrae]|uniref:Uncharacterized protein n=1 Tax=Microvirga terrae TaxID=2740529 RepID=A0ABY5RPA3_9HYPH|nr:MULTISPECIES: hypothetical protein [Microvirga]MBQ0823729.1 hypothetical protein [Microvirga sp. HBU67558]UVF18719.1 hypothetical protein HPT29_019840 [Microvirga terrae]
MTRLALTVSLLLLAGSGFAQEAPDGNALQLTVRPSGYEAEANEATARQERLLRRLEQSDHMIRSICINCGDSWKHQIYAPFNPLASLGRSGQPSEETGN